MRRIILPSKSKGLLKELREVAVLIYSHFRRKEPEHQPKKELDPEAKAAVLRETIPIEERVIVFRQMLEEKEVSNLPFH